MPQPEALKPVVARKLDVSERAFDDAERDDSRAGILVVQNGSGIDVSVGDIKSGQVFPGLFQVLGGDPAVRVVFYNLCKGAAGIDMISLKLEFCHVKARYP